VFPDVGALCIALLSTRAEAGWADSVVVGTEGGAGMDAVATGCAGEANAGEVKAGEIGADES